jgi:CubicO group peptidase (beta-lactamase class C family)
MKRCCCLLVVLVFPAFLHAETLPDAKPEDVGASAARLNRIDAVVEQSLKRGDAPGAVVLITHRGKVIFRRAYGLRSKLPAETPMTVDTVFDLASLTKPLATASSIMLLVEQGKLRPSDTVARHLPAFAAKGKDKITIEQLLLHTSGLIADNPVSDYADGREKAIQRICDLAPASAPGARFVYSDLNYILLGEIVERLSGMPLDEFAKKNLFAPLGLTTMGYKPDASLKDRFAPTE